MKIRGLFFRVYRDVYQMSTKVETLKALRRKAFGGFIFCGDGEFRRNVYRPSTKAKSENPQSLGAQGFAGLEVLNLRGDNAPLIRNFLKRITQ